MGDEGLTTEDFGYLCKELTAAFGEDYLKPDGTLHYKAKQVFSIACSEGMTKKEFREGVQTFLKNQYYPNWLPGQFFKNINFQKLHPDSWAIEEAKKTPETKNFMEGYEFILDGRKIRLWRYADGRELPFKKIYPKPELRMTVDPLIPDIDEATLKNLNMAKKYLEEKIKADNYKRRYEEAEIVINVQRKMIDGLKHEQEIDPKEYEKLKKIKLESAKIILELQEKIEKLRTWIIGQISDKTTDEQLEIWNKIWHIIEEKDNENELKST
jgi:hypothetical protein